MDWKQIETEWAAMARRIRADAQCGQTVDRVVLQSRTGKGMVVRSLVAKQTAATGATTTLERDPAPTH